MTDAEFTTGTPLVPSESSADEDSEFGAAIYARTSSSTQKFGYSIDEQIRRCAERCNQLNWEIRYVFADEAESGRDTERPDFQQLLRVAERQAIDAVIFWRLDRFCRSLVDLVKIEEQLSEWDVGLQSATEYIDTTSPVGRFNFRNLASAAELETDLTSKRVRMGMYGLAQEHKWPNDRPPLGYDKLEDGKLKVNEDEADLVRRIFRMYLREESMPQVAYLLNEDGIVTENGDAWCTQSIKKILSNEIYTGSYCVADFEDHVEEYRIITDDLFDEVTETRFRFSRDPMEKDRKEAKADRILRRYKEHNGFEG